MFDAAKYIALAVRLQMRAKQLRDNPPKTIAEYAALVEEGKAIFDELMGQRQQPDFDSEALKAQRTSDLDEFTKTDADLDNLPPLPVPNPVPAEFDYGVIFGSDPDDKFLSNKDEIYTTTDNGKKVFMAWGRVGAKPNLNFPPPGGWELHRRVTK